MASVRIKICGITQVDQAQAIAALGISTLGFICVRQSPRWIEPEAIGAIAAALERSAVVSGVAAPRRIGVFAQANVAKLEETVARGGLTGVQLHGDEPLEVVRQVRGALPGVELIKAVRVRSGADLALAQGFAPLVDALLLDAYHPTQLGGTGHRIDWTLLQQFSPGIPWLLAGGLTPENVTEALTLLQPEGIDLSSGVERSPGDKDLAKVKLLCHNLDSIAQIV